MLRVSNLRKDFTAIRAVDGVSFDVQSGHILGLIGRNGAGKTTTIRCILNIFQPDLGEILYEGAPFTEAVRNQVGYLPEERGLYRKSKLIDTILYFARLRGMEAGLAKSEAMRWLKLFELTDYKDKRVEELSKGNQQKVQFITSIIHDPKLIVLDEPFSGLDPVNQILFKDIFLELKQRGKAIIFSTHQMDQAEKLSDEICLIDHGRVVLSGSVRDVKKRYGNNTVHLEYEGKGAFLKSLPGVKSAMMYENSAELQLSDGFSSQTLLPLIIQSLELRKFELREPSLQSIFIDVVGEKEAHA
ncbi:MAG: ATP-binding cassette domain-containing protein [Ignavibacteriae bacterium]|nr:ATP-binding cassette domain-containing protein [Ignavibacteriota bacterium]